MYVLRVLADVYELGRGKENVIGGPRNFFNIETSRMRTQRCMAEAVGTVHTRGRGLLGG
jgi:hypothetical protein